MIKILGELPKRNIGLALSGGIDSMTIANFLLRGRKEFTAFYFNHGTVHGEKAEKFVRKWCDENDVPLIVGYIKEEYDPMVYDGPQDFYRCNRHGFLFGHSNEYNIMLAHHLDDVMETWLFSTFHGTPKLIPYEVRNRASMCRPFLLTTKEDIRAYVVRHDVEWIEDESNGELDYMRNRIRHQIIPEVEKINPGVRKHVARMIQDMYNRYLEDSKYYWIL
jgi:tRNA(Ile)-lysidine synthase